MSENSRFWDGVAVGDAIEAPYDAPTEFGKVLGSIIGAESLSDRGSVLKDIGGELEPSVVGATIQIEDGEAWVCGSWYENTAAQQFTIDTPVGATRVDRIVLRKDWTAQEVRLYQIEGTEGMGIPALTQIFGVTWDVPLAQASITTGGDITLTDDRPTPFLAALMVMEHYHTGIGDDAPQITGWDALADISSAGGADKVLGTDADGRAQVADPEAGTDIVNYETIEDLANADTGYAAGPVGLSGWTVVVQKVVTTLHECNILVIGTAHAYGGTPGGSITSLLQMDAVLGEERRDNCINGLTTTITIHHFFADVAAGAHTFNLMFYPSVTAMYAAYGRISIIAIPVL